MTPRLAQIPPGAAFLDTLAARWGGAHADPSRGLILLPTRRAARALADAFLHVGGGRPMLLPRITAIGAVDEAPMALSGALGLPPAVGEIQRAAVLARLVMTAEALPADRAWAMARELAALMDEAERAEIPLGEALQQAVAEEYAEHWQITLRFLAIVTEAWPAWLAERGLLNPVARQMALLREQARAWQMKPPDLPVWAAGFADAPPAATALLRVIAGLPGGCVVFPWLEATPDTDETHPQHAPQKLLAALGAAADEVEAWGTPNPRGRLLSSSLLPATQLAEWRAAAPPSPDQLFRLVAADAQEEAVAIAMVLREAIDGSGTLAALVTPDRALAVRVSAELLRWGIVADDSAGEILAQTPPAVFLRLLVACVAEELAPVELLALLKHPLAAAGLAPADCREAARRLELAVLRGARPPPGFTGLRRVREARAEPAEDLAFIERLRLCLEPLLRAVPPRFYRPADLLAWLIEAAEAMARTSDASGAARLWGGADGEALATILTEALAAFAHLPEQPAAVLPGLLDACLDGAVVRTVRALRGRDGTEHPQVVIWGLLEARLQTADVVVLGGLAEGVWPPATDPGPWMSRMMRRDAGLPSADAAIGQAAHDYVSAACGAPLAVLSSPTRRDGAPRVPSRWLARLDALLVGHKMAMAIHPAVAWARALDLPPDGRATPVEPPHPAPPAELRPRSYRVTDIEKLIADPFAIYAQKILRLERLDPIEQETDELDIGSLVHAGIERFINAAGVGWGPDGPRQLQEAMDRAATAAALRPALAIWWAPRLRRIADWIAAEETRRRVAGDPIAVLAEQGGSWTVGGFTLAGRADRLERRADGRLAILDYKTGQPPSWKNVRAGTAPQLAIEAAMAAAGAFGAELTMPIGELTYWRLSGGRQPGEASTLNEPAELAELAGLTTAALLALLQSFADPARPYPHHPHPERVTRFPAYAQLARALELAAADDGEAMGE